MHGLCFGLLSAVLQFNRHPALVVAIARRWLAIPAIHFFDDFKIVELAVSEASGATWFDKLVAKMGWFFDHEKTQHDMVSGIFLGGVEDYSTPDTIQAQPRKDRLEAIRCAIIKTLETGRLSPKEAASLHGKLMHLSQYYEGRVGRGHLHAIREFARSHSFVIGKTLRDSLEFHLTLSREAAFRTIRLASSNTHTAVIYTDASCAPQTPPLLPVVRVCFLAAVKGELIGRTCLIPNYILRSFGERQTYIAQGEALAPLLALLTIPDILKGSHILWFIDNLGVVSAFITGKAKIADFSNLVHIFHLHAVKLRTTSWFEHVDSCANPSDGGSRVGTHCPVARSLGFLLEEMPFPALPGDVNAPPEVWLKWFFN